MKTKLIGISFAAVLGVSLQAHAVVADAEGGTPWERPIAAAALEVKSITGEFKNVQKAVLTMTKQDGNAVATGFSLVVDDQIFALAIIGKKTDDCGSIEYSADLHKDLVQIDSFVAFRLVDNGPRICKDKRPTQWEAEMESTEGKMEAIGNPKAVFTIQ